jgi:pheromone shutdown protein TraB
LYLLLAIALPLIILRFGEMRNENDSENRDKIMADKIISAHEQGKSVLAVVGERHLEGVKDHLPDDLKIKVEDAEYKRSSITHLKEIALPVFTAFSVLYVIYLIVLWLSTQIIAFV